ncbi:hypothetical protein J4438_03825 [Candidatus Woesearchaeota archaeon]|nr:hypothetical protein [Candidatus Woesearchaeota archaeon]
MTEYFKADLHLHFPRRDEYKLLELAIERGINLLSVNDYGTTKRFDDIANNINYSGGKFLPSFGWGMDIVSPVLIRICNNLGYVYLIKGEEVKTKQGHVVALGIKDTIRNGSDIVDVLDEVFSNKGFSILAHPLSKFYSGCGEAVVREMRKKYNWFPLALEQNSQIPGFFGCNQDASRLANELGMACFGNSDIHGRYLREYQKVGRKLHSNIPRILVDESKLVESLEQAIVFFPRDITVEGETNSLLETLSWITHSVVRNGGLNLLDAVGIIKYAGERK